MSVNLIALHFDSNLTKAQSKLSNKSEAIFHESEQYHAVGFVRDQNLTLLPHRKTNSKLLQPLVKSNLDIEYVDTPFEDSECHVYFTDTNYPILYKQSDDILHFFLPGSNVNYDNHEGLCDDEIFSRASLNYFGYMLSHDKPLNEIFRNFQFNDIDCNSVNSIQMGGGSLGGSMQHFLLVYILQNIYRFNNLSSITLNIAAPSCFHSKLTASLSEQFNDAMLRTYQGLMISINYTIHLKDATARRGNPFALEYTGNSKRHSVVYNIKLYAYCHEKECSHSMRCYASSSDQCDIIPDGMDYKKYHANQAIMKQYKPYIRLETSDFTRVQSLIDAFFTHNDLMDTFERFIFNTYGYNLLSWVIPPSHTIIRAHENLADAIIAKYKSQSACSDEEIAHLYPKIHCLEEYRGIVTLQNLAQKTLDASEEQLVWNPIYLSFCSAKSELAKLIINKSTKKK